MKHNGLLKILCTALTAVFTFALLATVGLVSVKAEEITYDEVKIYDYSDLTGEESYTVSGSDTAKLLGTVAEKNNYAVKMKVSGWTGVPTHIILHIGGSDGWGNGGYIIHSEWEYGIYKDRGATKIAGTSGSAAYNDFTGLSEAVVEFGVKKAYEDGVYVGNYVYCKVNDVEKISVLDREGTEEMTGSGVYVPDSVLGISLQHMFGYTLSTTYVSYRVTVENLPEQIDMEESFTIRVGSGNTEILVPVAPGYVLDKVYVNGEDKTDEILVTLPGGYKLSFESVTGDMTLSFEVKEKLWTISGSESGDYTIEASESVANMENCTVIIRPEVGKLITSVKVNGEERLAHCSFDEGAYVLNLYVVMEDQTVEVTAEEKTFTVTAEVEGGGATATVETPSVGAYGTAKVTVELSEGYYITAVTANGKAASVNEDGEYILDYVREDIAVKITVTKSQDSAGTSSQEGEGSGCGSRMSMSFVLSLPVLLGGWLILKKKNCR